MQSRHRRMQALTAVDRGLVSAAHCPLPTTSERAMPDNVNTTETSYADGKILKHAADGVGVVTFNNPDKRNAMSLEMWEDLARP